MAAKTKKPTLQQRVEQLEMNYGWTKGHVTDMLNERRQENQQAHFKSERREEIKSKLRKVILVAIGYTLASLVHTCGF